MQKLSKVCKVIRILLSYIGFTTIHTKSIPITIKVVSLNPAHSEMYSIQHYVIKFVSDLRQVSGFLRVLRFLPPIKRTVMM